MNGATFVAATLLAAPGVPPRQAGGPILSVVVRQRCVDQFERLAAAVVVIEPHPALVTVIQRAAARTAQSPSSA